MYGDPGKAAQYWEYQSYNNNCALVSVAGVVGQITGHMPSEQEVIDAARARSCQLAVLVPAARMEHVEIIAGNLEKMPPKSTYFYPKLLSGLVFNPLTGS